MLDDLKAAFEEKRPELANRIMRDHTFVLEPDKSAVTSPSIIIR